MLSSEAACGAERALPRAAVATPGPCRAHPQPSGKPGALSRAAQCSTAAAAVTLRPSPPALCKQHRTWWWCLASRGSAARGGMQCHTPASCQAPAWSGSGPAMLALPALLKPQACVPSPRCWGGVQASASASLGVCATGRGRRRCSLRPGPAGPRCRHPWPPDRSSNVSQSSPSSSRPALGRGGLPCSSHAAARRQHGGRLRPRLLVLSPSCTQLNRHAQLAAATCPGLSAWRTSGRSGTRPRNAVTGRWRAAVAATRSSCRRLRPAKVCLGCRQRLEV